MSEFQNYILNQYEEKGLNPLSSIADEWKWHEQQIQTLRNQISLELQKYNLELKQLQKQAGQVQTDTQQLLKTQISVGQQTRFLALSQEIQKMTIPEEGANFLTYLQQFIQWVKELKAIKIPGWALGDELKEPLKRMVSKIKDKTFQKEKEIERRKRGIPLLPQLDRSWNREMVTLTQSILATLQLSVTSLLQVAHVPTTSSTTSHASTYERARAITLLQQRVKTVWDTFQSIENAILAHVSKTQQSLERNLTRLKEDLKQVPQVPLNPCVSHQPLPEVTRTNKDLPGKLPAKNNPHFALELRNQIVNAFPELQLDRRNVSEGSRCGTSLQYTTNPNQFVVGLLLHPRFKKIRGIVINQGLGSGKTGTAWQALLKWRDTASDKYDVSRDALVLVPNDQNIRDYIEEGKKMGVPYTDVIGGSASRYITIGDPGNEFHIVFQLYTAPMDEIVSKKLVKNNRRWRTFPFPQSVFSNKYEDFPEIYGHDPKDLPEPFVYPKKPFKERIILPEKGIIIIDEAHHITNPQEIRGTVVAQKNAVTWALSVKMNQTAKVMPLTATLLSDPKRPLDTFKLLNLVKFDHEPHIREGVWKKPLGHELKTDRKVKEQYANQNKLEARYVSQFLPKGADGSEAYKKLLTMYSGTVSYLTLEADPTVYPQVTTRCPGLGGCPMNVAGCLLRYNVKQEIQCSTISDPQWRLRAIPVYVTLPSKKTAKNPIVKKFAVALDIIQQSQSEKHYIFTGTKDYKDFFMIAWKELKDLPYYDVTKLLSDILLLTLPQPLDGKQVATALLQHSLNQNQEFEITSHQKGLLVFLNTSPNKEMNSTIFASQELYRRVKPKGSKVAGDQLMRVNKDFLQQVMLELFNSPLNDQGQLFSTFLADVAAREGVSLRRTPNVHFLQIPKTETSFRQALGRATRWCSFESMPDNRKWLVRAYLYIASADVCKGTGKKEPEDCKFLSQLLGQTGERSLDKDLENFFRAASLDCYLFGLYNSQPGETISCSLDTNMTEAQFRSRFLRAPTAKALFSPQNKDFGRICVYPNSSAFGEIGEETCGKEGEMLYLSPYNEIDAFILTVLYAEMEKSLEEEEEKTPPPTEPIQDMEKPKGEEEDTKPKPTKTWTQYALEKLGLRTQTEGEQEDDNQTSYQIMYPYLTCQVVFPEYGKISYHKIFWDLQLVNEDYKRTWYNILSQKRTTTADNMEDGVSYVHALEDMAFLHYSIILSQQYVQENLISIKDNLRKLPTTNLALLEAGKKSYNRVTSTAPNSSSPEIRYVLTEYDIDRTMENNDTTTRAEDIDA